MPATSWLEINLSRLDANLALFRAITAAPAAAATAAPAAEIPSAIGLPPKSKIPDPKPQSPPTPRTLICGVVKADAYGLGALPIAQRLAIRGIDMLAVFSPSQAEHLASITLSSPILVLMRMAELGRGDPLYRHAITGRLHFTIHDRPQLQELEHSGRMLGVQLPVHLYVDTGMSRGGITLEDLPAVLTELRTLRHLRIAGIYTHLASAESDSAFTDVQAARLDHVLATQKALLPPRAQVTVHLANTCATLRDPNLHRDMIRIGLGLYGYGPEQMKAESPLLPPGRRPQPIARWLSRVIHLQRYAKGTPVGYGSTMRLERDSVLGLVPVGYADGYPLSLSNLATVGVLELNAAEVPAAGGAMTGASISTPTAAGNPRPARTLGRVNMDQILIDLTDIPRAAVGSLVELIGDDPAAAWGLAASAQHAKSSCYEMLCRISSRVPRRYVSEDAAAR